MLKKKTEVGPKTYLLQFENKFDTWIPGQFVMMQVKCEGDEGTTRRAYSIANAPGQEFLELLIEQKDEKAKVGTFIAKCEEAISIHLEGPFGNFKLQDQPEKVVLLASGTGLAPMRAMLQELIKQEKEVHLLFCAKTNNALLLKDELLALVNKKVKVDLFVTREETQYNSGRITKDVITSKCKTLDNTRFYMCGGPEFVKGMLDDLKELGVADKLVHKEQW